MGKVANNTEYRRLSQEVCKHVKSGAMELYSDCLKKMAAILRNEQKYADEAKLLMLSYYVDLSGCGRPSFVNQSVVKGIRGAMENAGMDRYDMRELYLCAVGKGVTPRHIMTVSDSLYLLERELDGYEIEVLKIITDIELYNAVRCS